MGKRAANEDFEAETLPVRKASLRGRVWLKQNLATSQ
jgi:hypothetical protein